MKLVTAGRLGLLLAILLLAHNLAAGGEFAEAQARRSRVRQATANHPREALAELFRKAGLPYPTKGIYLRIFKKTFQTEDKPEIELWGRADGGYSLIKSYPVCYLSGELGPKRRQGDGQVPEGFYHVDRFNPVSAFHLSLGINYPNRSDRVLGERGALGGDIFIHGSCITIGCLPIKDGPIEELYLIAVDHKDLGRTIPVHIYPCRMHEERCRELLEKGSAGDDGLRQFWENLSEGYDIFETTRRLPAVRIDRRTGRYIFSR